MNRRRSELQCDWEDLLSGADIAAWVAGQRGRPLSEELPTDPGIYRWLFPSEGSEKPWAYVGEGENGRFRISDYLRAAVEPVTSAAEDSFKQEELREAIKPFTDVQSFESESVLRGGLLVAMCSCKDFG